MKNGLDMTYRKINKTPIHANSIQNRIMRKQCSHMLFRYAKKGFRLINIDETWLGGTNFQRRAWKKKDE